MFKRRLTRLTTNSDQGISPRKWSVDGAKGPIYLAADYVSKKLIQHRWPCRFVPVYDCEPDPTDFEFEQGSIIAAQFLPYEGSYFYGDFYDALQLCARVVSVDRKIAINVDGDYMTLDGEHYVTPRGTIRRGIPPVPF